MTDQELEEHIANMLTLKRIDALEAENGRMREALRPFVEYVHDDLRRGNAAYVLMPCSTSGGGWIGAEDLRRARAALKGEGE